MNPSMKEKEYKSSNANIDCFLKILARTVDDTFIIISGQSCSLLMIDI